MQQFVSGSRSGSAQQDEQCARSRPCRAVRQTRDSVVRGREMGDASTDRGFGREDKLFEAILRADTAPGSNGAGTDISDGCSSGVS